MNRFGMLFAANPDHIAAPNAKLRSAGAELISAGWRPLIEEAP
jgi:hypothetical protein